jgi:Ca2+-binding EF-hand superfamily protein
MQKSFTAALLCAITYAVKINDEVKSMDVEEQFNVQNLDWSD